MEGHPISHDPSIPARFTSHGSYNLVNESLRVTSWLRYRSLLAATGSAVVFAGLLYTFVEHIHLLSGGITYFWCVIGLLIPLTFGAHYAMEFVRNRQAAQDPNAALICSVEVCINNETVLTVKSWWSSNMSPADAERHGVRVAMSSARRWVAENSNPGGKVSRIKFSHDAAAEICERYVCQTCNHDSDEVAQCSVCLEDLEAGHSSLRMNKCGHVIHKDCLVHWVAQSGRLSCLLCRSDHFDMVPQSVLTQHIIKEEPVVTVLTVNIERGILTVQ